jgi:hypothetical protein
MVKSAFGSARADVLHCRDACAGQRRRPIDTRKNKKLVEKIKPAAPAHAHLLMAALMWTTVGTFMLVRAYGYTRTLTPAVASATAFMALAVGVVKGLKLLRPSAKKSAARIIHRGDGKCLGGFISIKSWLFVGAMILLGRALRMAGMPAWFTSAILGAVGVALLMGSAVFWVGWRRRFTSFKG